MPEKTIRLINFLNSLEQELRNQAMWQSERPSEQALSSDTPFCVDTLKFEQWLQFVFIERLKVMVQLGHPLPTNISICPMAEETFAYKGEVAANLINIIGDIDELLSGQRIQLKYTKDRQ